MSDRKSSFQRMLPIERPGRLKKMKLYIQRTSMSFSPQICTFIYGPMHGFYHLIIKSPDVFR